MSLSAGFARLSSNQLEHPELRETRQRPRHGVVCMLSRLDPYYLAVYDPESRRIPFYGEVCRLQLRQVEIEGFADAQAAREHCWGEVHKDVLPEFRWPSCYRRRGYANRYGWKRHSRLLDGVLSAGGRSCAVHVRITKLALCAGM